MYTTRAAAIERTPSRRTTHARAMGWLFSDMEMPAAAVTAPGRWPWSPAVPEVANPPLYLLLLLFATCIPFAWTVWVVWRAKAPAPFAGVMAAGILLHGASWHLSTLLPPPYDAVLEDAKGALMGFHLAFLVTFLMAAFEELSMDRACALACAVMLSMLVDSYSARDLPSVLTCGFDPVCWELPAVSQRKLDNVEELAVKLGGNCVLAVGCIWGVSLLRTAREEAAKEKAE